MDKSMTANTYQGWRGYLERRRYRKLHNNPASPPRRPKSPAQLVLGAVGGGRRRLLRRWGVKLRRRRPKIIKLFVFSPKKWLTKLRDAYVKMMLRLANSSAFYGGGFSSVVDYGGFAMPRLKEYDEKVIVEIYKSIVMSQGQLVEGGR